MAKKYAFVVSLDHEYILPLLSLLNSYLEYNMDSYADFIIFYDNFDASIFKTDRFCPILHKNSSIPYARYLEIENYAKDYDAICILDADMMFTADVLRFFEVSSHGFCVGCNDDSMSRNKHIYDGEGRVLYDNLNSHYLFCNVPFFFNYNKTTSLWDSFSSLHKKCNGRYCDYGLFNVSLLLNPEVLDRIIVYPSYCFTGVHHSFLKFETSYMFNFISDDMVENRGREKVIPQKSIISKDYMRVFSVHGKFHHPGHWENCIEIMKKYYEKVLRCQAFQVDKLLNHNKSIIDSINKIFIENILQGHIPYNNIKSSLKQDHSDYVKILSDKFKINSNFN